MQFLVAFAAILACACAAPSGYYPYPPYGGAYAYRPAQITVLPSGYLADTPEVAASKAASAVARASAAAAAAASPEYGSYPYAAPYYAGAYAHAAAPVTVLPSGFLADTPEVAAAKAAHFAEVAKASAAAAASPDHGSYPYAAPYYYGHHY